MSETLTRGVLDEAFLSVPVSLNLFESIRISQGFAAASRGTSI